ncbi:MAG: DUF86 domain-containing protein [Prevotellaceae bacterium]|jgi:uncharacterized protein with HEPN domain|nr:DUF86 domain-containing protein [Prevotellaceae bacterium]
MPDNKIYLKDIEQAITEIGSFLPEKRLGKSCVRDTRNRIIHGYDTVSEDILWLIIVNYLPNLEIQVRELLKDM